MEKLTQKGKITVISKLTCPFCWKTKFTLWKRGLKYQNYTMRWNKQLDEQTIQQLKQETNHNTFPFIFLGKEFIGGND